MAKIIVVLQLFAIGKFYVARHAATRGPSTPALIQDRIVSEKSEINFNERMRMRIEFWNAEPAQERYHVADIKYPSSR